MSSILSIYLSSNSPLLLHLLSLFLIHHFLFYSPVLPIILYFLFSFYHYLLFLSTSSFTLLLSLHLLFSSTSSFTLLYLLLSFSYFLFSIFFCLLSLLSFSYPLLSSTSLLLLISSTSSSTLLSSSYLLSSTSYCTLLYLLLSSSTFSSVNHFPVCCVITKFVSPRATPVCTKQLQHCVITITSYDNTNLVTL